MNSKLIKFLVIFILITLTLNYGVIRKKLNANGLPNEVWVDDDGPDNGYDHFDTIQEGINGVANNGTVYVYPGTYQEQLVINKSITLEGIVENGNKPIIKAPDTLKSFILPEHTDRWEPVVLAYGGADDGNGNISGDGTINFSMREFIVDGNNRVPTSYYSAGILMRNVKGNESNPSTISQNQINNMYIGDQITLGIFILGDSDVYITSNSINGYSKGGIVVNGDSTTSPLYYPAPNAIIQNNIVTGPGTASPNAPNGIQIGKGAIGKILNNTVTNNGYGIYGTTACGIIVAGSKDVEVSGNNVYQNKTGICIYSYRYSSNSLLSENTLVKNNTINENKYGITVQNRCQNTTIEYNTIQNSLVEGIALEWYGNDTNVPQNTIIRYNTISNNNTNNDDDGAGIWIDSNMGSVQIYWNEIFNNKKYGLLSYTDTIVAEYNWWGANDGPSGVGPGSGDAVSNYVDYEPWLRNITSTSSPYGDVYIYFSPPGSSAMWRVVIPKLNYDTGIKEFKLFLNKNNIYTGFYYNLQDGVAFNVIWYEGSFHYFIKYIDLKNFIFIILAD